jgi:hypothetical protein
MKMLLVNAIACACWAGFAAVFGSQARKARPIAGASRRTLVHGVRIALTDAELLDALRTHRIDNAHRV